MTIFHGRTCFIIFGVCPIGIYKTKQIEIGIHKLALTARYCIVQFMQVSKRFLSHLHRLAEDEYYLFSSSQLHLIVPDQSTTAFHSMLTRLCQRGELVRICRGIYLTPWVSYPPGEVLAHTAALLGAGEFCYLSLENVLSDAGVISQIPMQHLSLMTSGRRQRIQCGEWGMIEWIHTERRPEDVVGRVIFEPRSRLWRADVPLALEDMKRTGRSLDLLQEEVLYEFIG